MSGGRWGEAASWGTNDASAAKTRGTVGEARAEHMRGGKVNSWKDAAKPHTDGAIDKSPGNLESHHEKFHALFEKWLEVRDLGASLERVANDGDMLVYNCVGTKF